MDREYRLDVRRERSRELRRTKIKRILIWLDEDRTKSVLGDREDRGDVGIGRDRDGIALL
jgi:hypothetical protein